MKIALKVFNFLILFLALTIWGVQAQAAILEQLLLTPYGVRPHGMGNAFTAVASDASATFYNPAGLASPGTQLLFIDQDTGRAKAGIDYVHVINFGSISYYDRRVSDLTGSSGYFTGLSFAGSFKNGASLGLGIKNFNLMLPQQTGWTTDIGLKMQMTRYWSLGFLAQNFVGSDISPLQPGFRIGNALTMGSVTLASDLEFQNTATSGGSGSWVHLGLEYEMAKGLQLRTGHTRGHATAGISLYLPFAAVEYATEFDVKPLYYLGFKFGLDRDPIDPSQRQNFLFRQKEFVELSLSGALTSGQSTASLLGGNVQGVDPILELLRNAKKDDHVEGIIIRLGGLDTGLGTVAIVQEIRKELLDFKASGKKIYIYLESEALGNGYYLASVADYIMLPPGGAVGLLGLKLTVQRITQLYEKVGISWHVVKQGQYKDATNPFSKKMTPEQEAQLSHVVNDLYQMMIADIKKDNEDNNRLVKSETLDQLKEGQLVSATKAKEWKLVNEIGYYEDLLKHIDDSIDTNNPAAVRGRILPLAVYRNDYEQGDFSYFLPFNNRIAIIDIDGEIVQGSSGSNFLFGGKSLGSETIVKQLSQAMNDDQVKAIILRINSPGGSAIASDQIYQKVMKVKEKGKLVVASLGNLAASGGYYIASAADVIIGNSGTLAGSIGVIGMFPSYEKFNQIFGIDYTQIKSGAYLDMFDTHRTPKPEELKMVEDLMSETYDQFIDAVAKGRGKKPEEIRKIAGGQVYSGKQAMELGLIDKLGTYSDAIQEVIDRKHLKEYQFVRYTEAADPFMGPVRQGVKQVLGIPDSGILPELKAKMNQMQMIY